MLTRNRYFKQEKQKEKEPERCRRPKAETRRWWQPRQNLDTVVDNEAHQNLPIKRRNIRKNTRQDTFHNGKIVRNKNKIHRSKYRKTKRDEHAASYRWR